MSGTIFYTDAEDAWVNNSRTQFFKSTSIQSQPPNDKIRLPIAIGLNKLDIGRGAPDYPHMRIKAYVNNAGPNRKNDGIEADVHIDTWLNTRLIAAGCSWLDLTNIDVGPLSGLQQGIVLTGQTYADKEMKVAFPEQSGQEGGFSAPPSVIVWLQYVDVEEGSDTRFEASVTNVTKHDFTLQMRTWGTFIREAVVQWIAVPSDNKTVCVGQFTPQGNPSPIGDGLIHKSGYIQQFDFYNTFNQAPRVLVGLNKIDVKKGANLRVETTTQKVTNAGFEMVINSWHETEILGGGAAFIAVPSDI
ncbi:H-type lectin domain containing protein [Ceratobasidium theobromae]|uniref:H-type lectin domain containing protein n=1 Tax=Ceratobasidium theobromae TaxID=1582974 RepID=A0A5N5QC16_9AGAM|nr:H-type lectin domain containing protein [Ceratobasidium theobromae]